MSEVVSVKLFERCRGYVRRIVVFVILSPLLYIEQFLCLCFVLAMFDCRRVCCLQAAYFYVCKGYRVIRTRVHCGKHRVIRFV